MVRKKEEKIRVYIIAKEFGLDSKDCLKMLSEIGEDVKTASSSVSKEVYERLKSKLSSPKEEKKLVVLRKAKKEPLPEVEVKPAQEISEPSPEEVPSGEPQSEIVQERVIKEELVLHHEVQDVPEEKIILPKKEPVVPDKREIVKDEGRGRKAFKRKIVKKRDEIKTIREQLIDDIFEEEIIIEEQVRKKISPTRPLKKTEITTPKASKKIIRIEGCIVVSELAQRMGVKVGEVMKKLIDLGVMATVNQTINADVAAIISKEYGYEVEKNEFNVEEILREVDDPPERLKVRPPVVTIMGHVDHGKTTLLDAIRQTNVAEGEAGGITQHIGAYEVVLDGKRIIFLDTPGHEAFTTMRARGAQVTDIVVLVVAADDGVMPQTIEAINHARAAKVPIVVVINKIDKPNINPHLVRQTLSEYGLAPEEWGGDTLYAEVSAKRKTGIKELLDVILLQAEVLELKANPERPARGTIIESRLDRGRGAVATVLVQKGTLRMGSIIVAGPYWGKIKAMLDFRGERKTEAGPASPVEIVGLLGVPPPGEKFYEVENEEIAQRVVKTIKDRMASQRVVENVRYSLDDLLKGSEDVVDLNIIVKADVIGSLEAIRAALAKLSTDKAKCNIIHTGVGGITESDVMLASASKAVVIGFGVRAEPKAKDSAQKEGIELRFYNIIYDVIDDIRRAMEGMLKPVIQEKLLGRSVVKQTFKISKVGTVAGTLVTEGRMLVGAKLRILRNGSIIYDTRISSLRRFKETVQEVPNGVECGISLENFNDIKIGDIFEAYEQERVTAHL